MDLIAGFVSAYLALNAKEHLAFKREVDSVEERQEKRKVMELITEWEREGRRLGRAEGREEGRQEEAFSIVQRLLRSRLGELPRPVERRIRQLSLREIESLADALLDFDSLADLKAWLLRSKE